MEMKSSFQVVISQIGETNHKFIVAKRHPGGDPTYGTVYKVGKCFDIGAYIFPSDVSVGDEFRISFWMSGVHGSTTKMKWVAEIESKSPEEIKELYSQHQQTIKQLELEEKSLADVLKKRAKEIGKK